METLTALENHLIVIRLFSVKVGSHKFLELRPRTVLRTFLREPTSGTGLDLNGTMSGACSSLVQRERQL